jgi:hypothetical protein
MRVNARLEKLEAACLPAIPELQGLPVDFVDREMDRWDTMLDPLMDALGDEEAVELAMLFAAARFAELGWLVNPHAGYDMTYHRWAVPRWFKPLRRTPKALATFLDRLPDAMRVPVLRSGLIKSDNRLDLERTWLGRWLYDVCELDCRIPPDIDREAFGSVLDVFLTRREGIDHYFNLCPATGLRVPRVGKQDGTHPWKVLPGKTPLVGPPPWYDVPEFFAACPGCGADKYGTLRCQQASEQAARARPWHEWAATELDPD